MTRNQSKLLAYVRQIKTLTAGGDTLGDQLLKDVIVTLADEVIYLARELETVRSQAQRADRNTRMGYR